MRFLIPAEAPRKYNWHLHYGSFVKGLRAWGHEVFTYGSADGLDYGTKRYPKVMDAVRVLRPDVYIAINPFLEERQVREIGRRYPSLVIVGCIPDFHYRASIRHFECCDLALLRAQKHIASVRLDSRVRWYPFSVDEDVIPAFVPWQERHNRVFFSGAAQHKVYPARAVALDQMQGRPGFMDVVGSYQGYQVYLSRLSKARFALSCQSAYGIQPAKLVEYAAAGAIPLFDEPAYAESVIPHVLGYEPMSVVETVRANIGDPIWEQRAIANREHVLKHHTHRVRARQLLDWIENPV